MVRAFFLLLLSVQLFAIVAIKPREVGEKPGLSGELSGAFETKRGNTEKDNYSGSLQLQFDSNTTYVLWGVVRGEYGEASGVKDTDNLFAHLRYIRNIAGADIAAEGFGQMEKDAFKSIEERALAGGGVRWKVLNKKRGQWGGLFIGLGAYAEYIGYSTAVDPLERNLRFNSYLAYSLPLPDDALFAAVAYYQPKVDDANDYYIATSARVELRIYKQLYLGFRVGYNHDAKPAVGVKQDDFYQRTLFTFKF
ncbi:DUF481 domain-containing protein [Sulfurimonas sp. HSL-3221]|uniref:DUF481 domain-containing protein n=1 Tax=Sulfurimonadaceae TaxID=2771471 RepID=UPI001E4FE149|nr:DUF481 domain-containing protein [Sulfurimonas sp. HSL-3221]UFS62448.1 DUF481 domain-containing protein [Sulfurimonas sp. HSL-3221]